MRRLFAVSLMLTALVHQAFAQEEQHAQTPPQFTDYRIPIERAALPRATAFEYLDLVVLICLLVLGAWSVLRRRSRNEVRILSIFAVMYFGFYRLGCVCSIGSIQNVVYALTNGGYRLPLVVAGFFLLPLLAALFFGRVFCGVACPMGAMQDLLLIRPTKVPAWLRGPLETLPYLYLGGAVMFAALGTAFVICEYDPFVVVFRLSGHLPIVLFAASMLLISTFVGRPYCRFLCPYGVLLRWCSQFSRHQVTVSPNECIQCHMCASACPYDAIEAPSVDRTERRADVRRRARLALLLTPLLMATLALAGHRLAPTVARWDLRVHRAHLLRDAELHPGQPKTVVADAWDRHRHTNQDAYTIGASVERSYALATPLLGAWIGLVFGLKAIFSLRRRERDEYTADGAACVSCARCYSSCPVPHRQAGLFPLRVLQPGETR